MKIKIIATVITTLIIIAMLHYNQRMTPTPIDGFAGKLVSMTSKPFPDAVFKTPRGTTIGVSLIHEKTILVHFWAAWCAPCIKELPELLRYIDGAKGKIALLSVSMDPNYSASQQLLDQSAAKYNINLNAPYFYWAWDPGYQTTMKIFNTMSVPETIILDENRHMVNKIVGVGPWAEAIKKN